MLSIVKTAILNTFILNTVKNLEQKTAILDLFHKNFKRIKLNNYNK